MQEYPRYLYRAPFVVTGNGPAIADGAVLTENGLVADDRAIARDTKGAR